MSEAVPPILYYPNFSAKSLPGIRRCLLLADEVAVVAPYSTPYTQAVLADGNQEAFEEINQAGALSSLWQINPENPEAREPVAVRMLIDNEIAQSRTEEFLAALREDVYDAEVRSWADRWTRGRAREPAWFVMPSYFGGHLPVGELGIEEVSIEGQPLLKLPFIVGMSIGLSEALWAALDHNPQYTLFTDDDASEQFLMLRLRRGWKQLTRDPLFRDEFGIESRFGSALAGARLSNWTLRIKAPELWKRAGAMDIPELLELRVRSDEAGALAAFRAGITALAEDADLWQANDFRTFEARAAKIIKKDIEPAWAVLERKPRTAVSDIVQAFDGRGAVADTVRKAPDLFMRSPVAQGSGAAALGLAGIHLAPAALLALGCGVAATAVKGLLDEMKRRRAERRGAQYLSYVHGLARSSQASAE